MYEKVKHGGLLLVSFICLGMLFSCGDTSSVKSETTSSVASSVNKQSLVYTGKTLDAGKINVSYSADVATATGASAITYALKASSALPAGLALSNAGKISGTPTTAVDSASFVVVASAEGYTSAEGTFLLTINAAGKATYTFEAEYVDVSNLVGGGISGAGGGIDMIQPSKNASNGWFLGYTHKAGLTVTFDITADKAGTGAMAIGLGTEIGVIEMNPNVFSIKNNGTVISYTKFNVKVDSANPNTPIFNKYAITDSFNLVAGLNSITMTIGTNEYLNGATGGPLIDCMTVATESALTWNPITTNITNIF